MVDMRYEAYCLVDRQFYDTPTRWNSDATAFGAARRPAPRGWNSHEKGWWLVLTPAEVSLPPQGWKVHVSARPENAEEVLQTVWSFCLERTIPFKFLRTRNLLMLQNAKYASRGSSGKFATLYPTAEDELQRTLEDLGAALEGKQGPYILSDLRWGAGPLHVRYGGFAERYCPSPETGEPVLAIEDPDGELVPDRREPGFRVPDWVTVPDFLARPDAGGDSSPPPDFPYRIERALHFSNGGGVYLGVDSRSKRRVVLKEARPWAGLDVQGVDAVARLQREGAALERLSGLDVVPELLDQRMCWEHHFLVEEFVDGEKLNHWLADRYPLIHPDPSSETVALYTQVALELIERLEQAVDAIHSRGIVFGDLHPANVLIRPDGRVVFIDFELASRVEEEYRRGLFAPGYGAPGDRAGFDVDRYALSCIRLMCFLPLTPLFEVDATKAEDLVAAIADRFPVPDSFADHVLRDLGLSSTRRWSRSKSAPRQGEGPRAARRPGDISDGCQDWAPLRKSIAEAIVASATPSRSDRLFPGDIAQFTVGGLGIAHGAAGVLYALSSAGMGRHPQHEEWLLEQTRRAEAPRPGFYDGLHGVAYVLEHLGHGEHAMAVLDRATTLTDDVHSIGLFEGLAGIGLNLLHFAGITGDRSLLDATFAVADQLAILLQRDALDTTKSRGSPQVGLFRGFSGPALLFIRLYEHTADDGFLDLAAHGLRRDLARCVTVSDGTVQVDEGWRVLPYLDGGSAGIGMVLHEYLRHRADEQFATAQHGIRQAARIEFVVYPSLFRGRAGLLAYLLRVDATAPGTGWHPAVELHIPRLLWHAMNYQGHVGFPGEELRRLSMDLATGSAGILLAVSAALDGKGVALPFIAPLLSSPKPACKLTTSS